MKVWINTHLWGVILLPSLKQQELPNYLYSASVLCKASPTQRSKFNIKILSGKINSNYIFLNQWLMILYFPRERKYQEEKNYLLEKSMIPWSPTTECNPQMSHVHENYPLFYQTMNSPANAGDARDMRLVPRWERSPGGGHGNPRQYSTGRGAWQATVQGAAKSWTQLSNWVHNKTAHTFCSAKPSPFLCVPSLHFQNTWYQK